jgi:hypothetical protein
MSFFDDKMMLSEVIARLRELEENYGPVWTNVSDFSVEADNGFRFLSFELAVLDVERDAAAVLTDEGTPGWGLVEDLEYELVLWGDIPTNVWTIEEDSERQYRFIRFDVANLWDFEDSDVYPDAGGYEE